jgi:hypothetical protein
MLRRGYFDGGVMEVADKSGVVCEHLLVFAY